MPVESSAAIEITAFDWGPPFAVGLVRDLRVRWALEEAGLAYRERLLDVTRKRGADHLRDQPFGQVPTFTHDDIRMFESGAIVLHIAEGCEALMPADPAGRARAITWIFAALNTIEPAVSGLATLDLFHAGEDWAKARRPSAEASVVERLQQLSDHLGHRDFLEKRFTAGDLMMTSVLRILRHTDLLRRFANLERYKARCEARPAFEQALQAHMAGLATRQPTAVTR